MGFLGLGLWTLLAMSRVQGRVFTSSRVLEGLDKTFRRAQASRGLEGQGGLGGAQVLFHLCLTYLDVTGAVGVGGAVEAVGVVGVVGVGAPFTIFTLVFLRPRSFSLT